MWNFDIGQAPRGSVKIVTRRIGKNDCEFEEFVPDYIIAAGNGGVVTRSYWDPKAGKWSMFTKDVPPLAWMPWPKHPEAA